MIEIMDEIKIVKNSNNHLQLYLKGHYKRSSKQNLSLRKVNDYQQPHSNKLIHNFNDYEYNQINS